MGRPRSLRDSRDFRRVYSEGSRGRSDGITAWAASPSAGEGRIGIVVPGSVGTAVARNKVKRRLRDVLRALSSDLGHDVVVRADRSARALRFQDLENHVVDALRSTGAVT